MCNANMAALLEAMTVLQPRSAAAVLAAIALGHSGFNQIIRVTLGNRQHISEELRRLVALGLVEHDDATGAYTLSPSLTTAASDRQGLSLISSTKQPADSTEVLGNSGSTERVLHYDDDLLLDPGDPGSSSTWPRGEGSTERVLPKGTIDAVELEELADRLSRLSYRIDHPERLLTKYWNRRAILMAWAEDLEHRPSGERGHNPAGLLDYLTAQGKPPAAPKPKTSDKTSPDAYFQGEFAHLIQDGSKPIRRPRNKTSEDQGSLAPEGAVDSTLPTRPRRPSSGRTGT